MHTPATTQARIAAISQVMEESWDLYLDRQFHSGGYPTAEAAIASGCELLGITALDAPDLAHLPPAPVAEDDTDPLDPLTPYAGVPHARDDAADCQALGNFVCAGECIGTAAGKADNRKAVELQPIGQLAYIVRPVQQAAAGFVR